MAPHLLYTPRVCTRPERNLHSKHTNDLEANITGLGGWEDALEKAKAFVAQLTVEEKADLVTGQAGPCVGNIVAIPRLGFGGLCLQDGPLAIRVADYASVFSAGISGKPDLLRYFVSNKLSLLKILQVLLNNICK